MKRRRRFPRHPGQKARLRSARLYELVLERVRAVGEAGSAGATVRFDPPAAQFAIDAHGQMPVIKAVCEVAGHVLPQRFEWTATLELEPAGVPHAMNRVTRHPVLHAVTATPEFPLPFTAVRGGMLLVNVTATLDGKPVKASAKVPVLGTNPTAELLRAEGAPELLLKLMMAESGLRQFGTKGTGEGYPLFSGDNLGGVGLGQITIPAPTDDEVWHWKANLRAARALFEQKQQIARHYLSTYAASPAFQELVGAFHAHRKAAGHEPVEVTLPAFTPEMLDNETLRLYNGEAGRLHEYVARQADGLLAVQLDADGKRGTAEWAQVTPEERKAHYVAQGIPQSRWGDPDYVSNVRGRTVA